MNKIIKKPDKLKHFYCNVTKPAIKNSRAVFNYKVINLKQFSEYYILSPFELYALFMINENFLIISLTTHEELIELLDRVLSFHERTNLIKSVIANND